MPYLCVMLGFLHQSLSREGSCPALMRLESSHTIEYNRHTRGCLSCVGARYSFETRILPRSRFQTFRCPLRLLGTADAPSLVECGLLHGVSQVCDGPLLLARSLAEAGDLLPMHPKASSESNDQPLLYPRMRSSASLWE